MRHDNQGGFAVTEGFRVRNGLPVQRLGDELMVFDPAQDEVHVLNETSAAIWEGVQDGLDVVRIASRLGERYDLGGIPDPRGLILAALEEMAGKGILERGEPGAAGSAPEKSD